MLRVVRPLAAVLIVGISLGAVQSVSAQSASASKTRSDTIDFSATGAVEINNQTGSITVRTWDRTQVGYKATLSPSEGDSVMAVQPNVNRSAQKLVIGQSGSWSIQIPGVLTISTDQGDDPVGDYQVVMPKAATLEIDDSASTIEVTGTEGSVDVNTRRGTVRVHNVKGNLSLDTHTGSIKATGLRGSVALETHSGRITAAFDAFTTSSSVETHSGAVRLFLPADAGFELQLDLDEEDLTVDEAFGSPTSSDDDRRAYNGGGPAFEVESSSGPVEVRPLKAGPSAP